MGATPAKNFIGRSAYDRSGDLNLTYEVKAPELIQNPQLPNVSGFQGIGGSEALPARSLPSTPRAAVGGVPSRKAEYSELEDGGKRLPRPMSPLRKW
jgi:hypothetical protein